MRPADEVEALEGLVDEVERMSAVGEDAIGFGGEQQVGQSRRRRASGDRGQNGALGCVAVADGGPAPQPTLQRGMIRSTAEGERRRCGAAPSQSAATRAAPWNSARKTSSSGRMGNRLPSAVRMVIPLPQPSRWLAPNSAAWRRISSGATPAAIDPAPPSLS